MKGIEDEGNEVGLDMAKNLQEEILLYTSTPII
jgi:hypothetical protein